MSAWQARWTAMTLRERAMLLAGAGMMVLAILFLVAFEPAWNGRAKLQKELPRLREEAAQLEQLAREATQLKAQGQEHVTPGGLTEALKASLAQKGLEARLAAQPDGSVQVSLGAVHAGVLMTWIETVQRELRVRVSGLKLEQTEKPGTVDAELTFAAGRKQG